MGRGGWERRVLGPGGGGVVLGLPRRLGVAPRPGGHEPRPLERPPELLPELLPEPLPPELLPGGGALLPVLKTKASHGPIAAPLAKTVPPPPFWAETQVPLESCMPTTSPD